MISRPRVAICGKRNPQSIHPSSFQLMKMGKHRCVILVGFLPGDHVTFKVTNEDLTNPQRIFLSLVDSCSEESTQMTLVFEDSSPQSVHLVLAKRPKTGFPCVAHELSISLSRNGCLFPPFTQTICSAGHKHESSKAALAARNAPPEFLFFFEEDAKWEIRSSPQEDLFPN